MLQCRSRSPDSCRFLIRESGASGREVRWQPKLRLLSDGCVDWRATRQPLPFLNMSVPTHALAEAALQTCAHIGHG